VRCPAAAAGGGRGAQHPEELAQLSHGRARGLADDLDVLYSLHGLAGQQRGRRVGLDGDQADVVRDHVVQFPGDPGPLLGRGQRHLPVAHGLRPLRSRLRLLQVGPAGAADNAGHPGGNDANKPGELASGCSQNRTFRSQKRTLCR